MKKYTTDMDKPTFQKIITVNEQHVRAFRTLRLRGLQEHPEQFGETAAAFMEKSDIETISIINSQAALGGFILAALSQTGEMIGVVGLEVSKEERTKHRAWLWGMYVTPESRRQGVGQRLIGELLLRAEQIPNLEQIHLAVVTSNAPAIALYERMGFIAYGTDPRVLKVGDRAFDEHLMIRRLGQDR